MPIGNINNREKGLSVRNKLNEVIDLLNTGSFSGSFSGSFQGDGSNLTGVTAEWDGSHVGDANITGSLTISGSNVNLNVVGTITASSNISSSGNIIASIFNGGEFSGSFSGSFEGDGSGLTNIPASGIVGLNLSRIASGSATASISPSEGFIVNVDSDFQGHITASGNISASGNIYGTNLLADSSSFSTRVSELETTASTQTVLTNLGDSTEQIVEGSLKLTGNITAEQYIISSSVSYYTQSYFSGSTKFGDTLDDTHQFTGSLLITGSSVELVGGVFSGSGANLYNVPASGIVGLNLSRIASGSVTASITPDEGFTVNTNSTITGSLIVSSSFVDFTLATGVSGSFSGSFQGDGTNLTGITAEWDGSHVGDASITGSLTISGSGASVDFTDAEAGVSGSFSGSFEGDGSGLTGIPASGIVGLNLSRIATGSVTASVDVNNGFNVNANATITGSLTISQSLYVTSFSGSSLRVAYISASGEVVAGDTIVDIDDITADQQLSMSIDSNWSGSLYTGSSLSLLDGQKFIDDLAVYEKYSGSLYRNFHTQHKITTSSLVGTNQEIDLILSSSYVACHWNYYAISASNCRTGQVMSTWLTDGTVTYTDTSAPEIGNTTDFVISVDTSASYIRLLGTTTTDTFNVTINRFSM